MFLLRTVLNILVRNAYVYVCGYGGLSECGICVFCKLCPVCFLVVGKVPSVLL